MDLMDAILFVEGVLFSFFTFPFFSTSTLCMCAMYLTSFDGSF